MEKSKGSWVQVNTSPGIFSSEVTVNIQEANGVKVSILADKNFVQKYDSNEYLKVSVVNDDKLILHRKVLLPTETFETSSRWVVVNSNMVRNDIK